MNWDFATNCDFYTYIFATWCRRPLMFQTIKSVIDQIVKVWYQRFKPSGCKDMWIRKFEFEAKTPFLFSPTMNVPWGSYHKKYDRHKRKNRIPFVLFSPKLKCISLEQWRQLDKDTWLIESLNIQHFRIKFPFKFFISFLSSKTVYKGLYSVILLWLCVWFQKYVIIIIIIIIYHNLID